MDVRLSTLIDNLEGSLTIAVDDAARRLRAEGRRILSLGAGQPDFDTPEPIRRAAADAIAAGCGHYTAVAGTDELRRAIAAKLERDNGLDYAPEQIVVSNGAKHSLYNTFMATLEPGDGVVVPGPYWVSYTEMVKLAGGRPVVVPTDQSTGFKIDAPMLEQTLDAHPFARMIILNSPCNPTGAVYAADELEALAAVVRARDLIVVTDEIYEKIVYDGVRHTSFAAVAPDLTAQTILVNGVSKAFAMTGWRIGYVAAAPHLAKAMTKLQGQSTGNAAAVSQAAAHAALTLEEDVIGPMLAAYNERRRVVTEGLERVPGVSVLPPDGTFYCFPDVSGLMQSVGAKSSVELAQRLLESVGVALVPGSAFGAEGYLRVSFAADPGVIREAVELIGAFAADPAVQMR